MKKILLILMFLFPIMLYGQTRNIVPRAGNEGRIGTFAKPWLSMHTDTLYIGGVSVYTLLAGVDSSVVRDIIESYGYLNSEDGLQYPTNVVKSGNTFYFRNANNDTLFTATDAVGEPGGGITSVSEDSAPVLGGNLDLGDYSIFNTTPTFTITVTEMSYLDGVTSPIQTQLNSKASNASLDSVKDKIDLKLFEDFTQYDADIPETTDLFIFQDVGSGVPKRIAFANLVDAIANLIPGDQSIGTIETIDSIITAFWNNELGGGSGGANPDSSTWATNYSVDTKLAGKQDALGFTPENVTNKATNLTSPDNTKYPTTLAVSTALSGKQDALGYTPESVANKVTNLTSPNNTTYPTTQAVATAIESILNEGDGRVPYMWALLQPDTMGTFQDPFIAQTDVDVSTLTTSNVVGLTSDPDYGVFLAYIDSGEYRVKYDLRGIPTWTNWRTSPGYFKNVDSAQVRHYSSASGSTQTTQTLFIGNDSEVFNVTTRAGGGGGGGDTYITDSLILVFDYTDLANGSVDGRGADGGTNFWNDQIFGRWTLLTLNDTTRRPIKTADGVVFDGNDALMNPFTDLDTLYGNLTIEAVVYLTDTTLWRDIFGALDGSSINMHLRANRFCVAGSDGTTIIRKDVYSSALLNTWTYIVGTYDGSSVRIYFNGVEQTQVSTYLGETGNPFFTISTHGNPLPAGSMIRYLAIRRGLALSEAQVTTNYGSTKITGFLP